MAIGEGFTMIAVGTNGAKKPELNVSWYLMYIYVFYEHNNTVKEIET